MKNIVFLIFLTMLLLTQQNIQAQNAFYDWIGKDSTALKNSLGQPANIPKPGDKTTFAYKTKLGYQSFIFQQDTIIKVDNTTFWKTKGQAKAAFNLLISFYKKDGFDINKKTQTLAIATNTKYSAKINMKYQEKFYWVSETVTNK